MTRRRHRLLLFLIDRLGALAWRRCSRPLPSPARIVLVRPEHFGDLVLTLPVIRQLRRAFPEARWRLLVRPEYRDWMASLGVVDEVQSIDPPWTRRPAESPLHFWWDARRPKGLDNDLAIVLHGDLRTVLLARICAPRVAGYRNGGGGFLMDIALRRPQDCPIADCHATLAAEIARRWGDAERAVETFSWPEIVLLKEAASDKFPPGDELPANFLILHPGAGQPAKQWRLERWIEVGEQCLRRGWNIVLTGSKEEVGICGKIETELVARGNGRIRNLAGRTPLPALPGVVSRARAVVAPDTGIIHLARLLRVPTVALFGPVEPRCWGYHSQRHCSLYHRLPCSFCGRGRCPRRDFPDACMKAITVDEVMRAIEAVIAAPPIDGWRMNEAGNTDPVVLSDQGPDPGATWR